MHCAKAAWTEPPRSRARYEKDPRKMSLACQSDLRRDAVRRGERNGLDYIEVVDGPPTQLYVYFLGKLPPELATKKTGLARYLRLTGGDRITGLKILDVTPQAGVDDQHDDFLVVTLDRVGDFSTYTLALAGVEGIDPRYASSTFTFRIDCASRPRLQASLRLPATGAGRAADQLSGQGLRELPPAHPRSPGAAGARLDGASRA